MPSHGGSQWHCPSYILPSAPMVAALLTLLETEEFDPTIGRLEHEWNHEKHLIFRVKLWSYWRLYPTLSMDIPMKSPWNPHEITRSLGHPRSPGPRKALPQSHHELHRDLTAELHWQRIVYSIYIYVCIYIYMEYINMHYVTITLDLHGI